jgi:hypothetical protein
MLDPLMMPEEKKDIQLLSILIKIHPNPFFCKPDRKHFGVFRAFRVSLLIRSDGFSADGQNKTMQEDLSVAT